MQAQNNPQMSFEKLLYTFSPWVNKDRPSHPLNRYTLKRNVAGFPFGEKISSVDAKSINDKLVKTLFKIYPNGYYFNGSDLTDKNFHLLFEHLFLSNREALPKEGGVFIDMESKTVALIHLEDHLTIFFHDIEFTPEKILNEIQTTEQKIGEDIPYAYLEKFGYTTSSVLTIGTGLTKEAILHTPALNYLKRQVPHSDKVLVHGFDAERDVLHDLVICSNKYTLGISEKNISRSVDELSEKIVNLEKEAKEEFKKELPKELFNAISKDYGSLLFCKSLDFHESLKLASSIDLGLSLGMFESTNQTLFFDLFFMLRRAHLEAFFSDQDIPIEEKRALLFKEKLKDIKPLFC